MHSYISIKQGNDNLLKFNFTGFYEYLTSIAGGKKSPSSATTIVTDIQNYFLYTNPNSNTALPYYDLLLDMNRLKNYLQHLQNNFQFAATTISEKIRRLRIAIEYTLYKENANECNTIMFMRCTKILTNLSKWGRSITKEIRQQRNQHALVSQQEVCFDQLLI